MEEDLSKSIEERIELFKNDLLNLDDSNNDDVLNHFIIKWIIEGDNFYLNNISLQKILIAMSAKKINIQ